MCTFHTLFAAPTEMSKVKGHQGKCTGTVRLCLACAVQDAGAMEQLLCLVVMSNSDEDYGEACWALLAAVSRFMHTAETPWQVLKFSRRCPQQKYGILQKEGC